MCLINLDLPNFVPQRVDVVCLQTHLREHVLDTCGSDRSLFALHTDMHLQSSYLSFAGSPWMIRGVRYGWHFKFKICLRPPRVYYAFVFDFAALRFDLHVFIVETHMNLIM